MHRGLVLCLSQEIKVVIGQSMQAICCRTRCIWNCTEKRRSLHQQCFLALFSLAVPARGRLSDANCLLVHVGLGRWQVGGVQVLLQEAQRSQNYVLVVHAILEFGGRLYFQSYCVVPARPGAVVAAVTLSLVQSCLRHYERAPEQSAPGASNSADST